MRYCHRNPSADLASEPPIVGESHNEYWVVYFQILGRDAWAQAESDDIKMSSRAMTTCFLQIFKQLYECLELTYPGIEPIWPRGWPDWEAVNRVTLRHKGIVDASVFGYAIPAHYGREGIQDNLTTCLIQLILPMMVNVLEDAGVHAVVFQRNWLRYRLIISRNTVSDDQVMDWFRDPDAV